MRARRQDPEIRGWVLYDDNCGFCRGWIPFRGFTLRRRGFGIATLQSLWVREAVALDGAALLADLRLLLRDGRQVKGADVYRHVMRRIWWARPLWVLACAPGPRRVFDAGYRAFATHRHRFSRACGLPAPRIEARLPSGGDMNCTPDVAHPGCRVEHTFRECPGSTIGQAGTPSLLRL